MSRSHHRVRPAHVHQRLYGLLGIPILLLLAAYIIANPASGVGGDVSVFTVIAALFISFLRLMVAFILALTVAIPFSLLIHRSLLVERSVMPMFDTAYSVPVVAFFPVVIIFFNQYHFLEGAAVFVIFITMVWALVIMGVNGLRTIPQDIHDAAQVFGVRGFAKIRHVVLPAIIPSLVNGSLLAWAISWNMLLVAEVLHNYTPNRTADDDLLALAALSLMLRQRGRMAFL